MGLVSRTGIVPISHTQDTAGPMTRHVVDAAVLLQAMAGPDPDDPATRLPPERFAIEVPSASSAPALKGARLGVLRSATGYHEAVDAAFEHALDTLAASGAVIVDDLRLEPYDEFRTDSSLFNPWSAYPGCPQGLPYRSLLRGMNTITRSRMASTAIGTQTTANAP